LVFKLKPGTPYIRTTQRTTQSNARAKGLSSEEELRLPSRHKRRKGKEEDVVNASSESRDNLLPWGPEMLKSSLMLRSVYSHVKKPLRKTPSKYKDYR
jgi:hypothetical protein